MKKAMSDLDGFWIHLFLASEEEITSKPTKFYEDYVKQGTRNSPLEVGRAYPTTPRYTVNSTE